MKRRNMYIGVGILIAALLAGAVYKSSTKPKGEGVRTELVQKRTIREIVSASGKIYPEKEVKISSDVSGELVELLVKEGDTVQKGQLLARVNPDQYVTAVERGDAGVSTSRSQLANAQAGLEGSMAQKLQAEAQREQAEAQLTNVTEIHQRNEQLYKDGVISKAELDASVANLRQAQATLRSAQGAVKSAEAAISSNKENIKSAQYNISSASATLKELRTSLQRTSLYAPVGGIISKLNVEKGERVVGTMQMTGTEIMRIANFTSMEVRVDVNENDVLRVSVADTASIEVDAYLGRTFKGVVTEIAASSSNIGTITSAVTDQVTNFVVKIRIDAASYQDLLQPGKPFPFRPGMSASVDITTDVQADVWAVPIQAVTTRDANATPEQAKDKKAKERNANNLETKKDNSMKDVKEVVFVMRGDTVQLQTVKTGIQDDNYIQILDGLKGGEQIVSGPYAAVSRKLQAGNKVHLLKDEDTKTETD